MSYSFNEVLNFKAGETYWEGSQYGQIQFVVMHDPMYENGRLWFEGKCVDNGEVIDFLLTEGFEHYGPSFYDSSPYITF